MRCIAIDDEPIALQILEQFCRRFGGLELQTFSDPVLGLQSVKTDIPDVLFLDIEMNGISGLEVAKELPEGIFLVFTTAYAKFAVDGFDLNAVDFLHKPFSFVRFSKAVNKVAELKKLYTKTENILKDIPEITVRAGYQNVRISVASISYIEAMDSYVKIFTDGTKPVVTQMSMKSVMDMLPEQKFIRIHKSFIVAVDSISRYSRNKVILFHKKKELPVGRAFAKDFFDFMSKYGIKTGL